MSVGQATELGHGPRPTARSFRGPLLAVAAGIMLLVAWKALTVIAAALPAGIDVCAWPAPTLSACCAGLYANGGGLKAFAGSCVSVCTSGGTTLGVMP